MDEGKALKIYEEALGVAVGAPLEALFGGTRPEQSNASSLRSLYGHFPQTIPHHGADLAYKDTGAGLDHPAGELAAQGGGDFFEDQDDHYCSSGGMFGREKFQTRPVQGQPGSGPKGPSSLSAETGESGSLESGSLL